MDLLDFAQSLNKGVGWGNIAYSWTCNELQSKI